MTDQQPRQPLFRVVRGTPDDAELAALTLIIAGIGAGSDADPTVSRSRWAGRAALVRAPLPFGPGAWQAAGLRR
jgi:hypothetical protein